MQFNHLTRQARLRIAIMAMAMTGLVACQSTGPLFATAPVPPEKRIAIQPSGPHQGEADTGELVVGYTYQLATEPTRALHIAGGLRDMKVRGDAVNIYLNFLDTAGGVLQKKILYASSYRRPTFYRRPSTFDTTLPLPPGTVAIAFSSYVQPSAGRQ